ncbi:MAG: aminotransferase class IV [Spirochaetia bacterium]
MKHAVRNGNLIREEQAVLPVTKREVFFNFSVYESLKVGRGTPLFAEEHIERFFESARILGLSHPFSAEELGESIKALVRVDSIKEGTVKLMLVGGEEPLYLVYSSPLEKYSRELYSNGIKVITYPGERILPRAKSNCLLLNYIAGREAARNGALEALLVDPRGMVTEGTRSNLFAVTPGGVLVTPGEDVLYGVTRRHIIESARLNGIGIRFEKVNIREISAGTYSELFISSTSMGAMPVDAVDGEPVRAKPSEKDGEGASEKFPTAAFFHGELKKMEEQEMLNENSLPNQ